MNYKSFSQLNDCIQQNISRFQTDIKLVVGIPRSGMMPANLLALYLNKPYTDIDSFINGTIYGGGERFSFCKDSIGNNILVVDDSILSGNALNNARKNCKL